METRELRCSKCKAIDALGQNVNIKGKPRYFCRHHGDEELYEQGICNVVTCHKKVGKENLTYIINLWLCPQCTAEKMPDTGRK